MECHYNGLGPCRECKPDEYREWIEEMMQATREHARRVVLALDLPARTGEPEACPPREPVVAGDVGGSLGGRWVDTSTAAAMLGIDRSTIDEMVKRAPKGLPGAPVNVGAGTKRSRWRWDADRLAEWATAYHAARKRRR